MSNAIVKELCKLRHKVVELESSNLELKRELEELRKVKESQEWLEKERKRLYWLLDELPAFVYLQAQDYSITYANRFFWDKFGSSSKGEPCYRTIFGYDKPCERCETFEVFATKKPQTWQWEDNGGRAYHIYNYPFLDIDNSFLVLVLGFDISEHKRLERMLSSQKGQLQEQLFFSNALKRIAETVFYNHKTQAILENIVEIIGQALSHDRVLIYDIDFEKNQGIALCEWLDSNITSINITYDLDLFSSTYRSIKDNKQPIESHFDAYNRLLIADGVADLLHKTMHIKSLLWYPFGFRKNGFYCLIFNQVNNRCSLRKEELEFINAAAKQIEIGIQKLNMQQERERSQEAFSKAFNFSPDPMTITSFPEGRLIDVNESWLKVMGYKYNETVSKTIQTLKIWKDIAERNKVRSTLEEKGAVHNLEMVFVKKNGEERIGLFSGDIITLYGKKCCLAVIKDITELRKFEKEIIRIEQLNLVGQMAAGIAHEVRNPMTTVRGFLQMFRSNQELTGYTSRFDLMIDELDRANAIISQFLSLAKSKPVDQKMQNLNSVIETLYPLIQADAFESDTYISLDLHNIPDVLIDEKEMRQLILNLTSNGLQAMDRGKTLTIKTYPGKNEVVLAVQDQGAGIEPDLVDKLGTPFLTTKDEGTGLGLAVCYSVAARHNAIIEVKTGAEGTTFFVRFKVPQY